MFQGTSLRGTLLNAYGFLVTQPGHRRVLGGLGPKGLWTCDVVLLERRGDPPYRESGRH